MSLQALVFLGIISISGPHAADDSDLSVARREIHEAHQSYSAALKSGDAAAIASHFTEDAVLLPQGAEMQQGRSAIQQWFAGLLSMATFQKFTVTTVDVILVGDTAVETGVFRMSLPAEESSGIGKYLMVWKRSGDGKWKILRDMFNMSPRPTPSK
jgi:uncharacterized protein (TIGR02246 family)